MKGLCNGALIPPLAETEPSRLGINLGFASMFFHEKKKNLHFFELKMHRYVLEEATRPFSFLPCFSVGGQFLTEIFVPLGATSQVVSRSRLRSKRDTSSRKANRKSRKQFPFKKMTENMDL